MLRLPMEQVRARIVASACFAVATAIARPRRSVHERNHVMYKDDTDDDDDEQMNSTKSLKSSRKKKKKRSCSNDNYVIDDDVIDDDDVINNDEQMNSTKSTRSSRKKKKRSRRTMVETAVETEMRRRTTMMSQTLSPLLPTERKTRARSRQRRTLNH